MTRLPANVSAPGASPATDALRRILWRLDDYEQPVFTFDDVRRWPKGQLDRFVELGLVRKDGMADSTINYDCEHHCDIDYDPQTLPNGRVVITHGCMHGCGLAVLEPEWFQLWDIRFDGLARALASSLALVGHVDELVPGVLFLLGQHFGVHGALDVFLARRLTKGDAPAVIDRAPRLVASRSAVVLVPSTLPRPDVWPGLRLTFLAASDFATWDHEAGQPELASLAVAVRSISPPLQPEEWLTVSQCAELLLKDVSGLDGKKAMARVSWAAGKNKFRANGKKGSARRIDRVSFDAWRLEQRERDLDDSDW